MGSGVAAIVALLALSVTPTTTAKRAGVKTHDVDMFWTPDAQDLDPGPIVVDSFVSEGPPFARSIATTYTPRSQTGGDMRSGRWEIYVGPGTDTQSKCFGTFKLDRNVVRTEDDFQEVEYGGVLKIKGCRKAKEFKKLQPGKLGTLRGETICTLRRCKGTLEIEGDIRY
jgi:hypothetical protein